MKKSYDYFAALARQSKWAQQSGTLLGGALARFDFFALPSLPPSILSLAAESGAESDALVAAAAQDFLPPIDRLDLVRLSRALSEVAFAAAEAALQLEAQQLPQLPRGVTAFAPPLLALSEALEPMAAALPVMKKNSGAALAISRDMQRHSREAARLVAAQNPRPAEWVLQAALRHCIARFFQLALCAEEAVIKNI